MKYKVEKFVEIPQGMNVSISGNEMIFKFNGKETRKRFNLGKIVISIKDNKISVCAEKSTKRELKMIGTIVAHLNNLMKGTKENFVYQLEICNVHFPMTLKVEGDLVKIKSFLGEKIERKARILPNAKVEIKGNKIEVSSYDIEAAGQTAANLEQATKIRNRDRRIFQDGIFITETPKGKI
jgi:large subunit ribosomal protein L6